MLSCSTALYHLSLMLKETIEDRMNACNIDFWALTKKMAELRNRDPNSISGTVKKALANPEKSSFQTLSDIFQCLGVDIEKAIAIAAGSTTPKP